ncbi:hypothetical protein MLC59_14315 [Marinobacter bryozoorum]|uniref:hypothetical protein n=1 Tax=Marinobacter bryozoorum TaxID=256324 RepID=UPI002006402D|nr:hypothetical protein [Marinobacter bryozoorum]MCK7545338.1 hypothetical protein [Marinobacter bryozoorum]
MITATLRPRPAKDPTVFYDDLAMTLTARRDALIGSSNTVNGRQPLAWEELVEWLRFQCWYRRQETDIIDSWLDHVPQPDILTALRRQLAEAGRHYRRLLAHLDTLGTSMADWSPEPEWVNWASEFHASGSDTLERIIAHNLAGAPGAMEVPGGLMSTLSEDTHAVLEQLRPDSGLHATLGRMVANRYATTLDAQAQTHARVMRAFEREQKGRLALDRRIRAIRQQSAANDAIDDGLAAGGHVS